MNGTDYGAVDLPSPRGISPIGSTLQKAAPLQHQESLPRGDALYKKGVIAVVSLGLFCDLVLLTIIVPFLPVYLEEFNIDNTMVGLLFSSKVG